MYIQQHTNNSPALFAFVIYCLCSPIAGSFALIYTFISNIYIFVYIHYTLYSLITVSCFISATSVPRISQALTWHTIHCIMYIVQYTLYTLLFIL